MDRDQYDKLISNCSLSEEIDDNWPQWVCRPIIAFPMAPRHARALLEIAGILMSHGISIERITGQLLEVASQAGVQVIKADIDFNGGALV